VDLLSLMFMNGNPIKDKKNEKENKENTMSVILVILCFEKRT